MLHRPKLSNEELVQPMVDLNACMSNQMEVLLAEFDNRPGDGQAVQPRGNRLDSAYSGSLRPRTSRTQE